MKDCLRVFHRLDKSYQLLDERLSKSVTINIENEGWDGDEKGSIDLFHERRGLKDGYLNKNQPYHPLGLSKYIT